MQNLTGLQTVYAEELVPGARNAIRTCLRIAPHERVVLVTDLETEEIAASLADQVREVGAPMRVHVMEDYGPRPMLTMPGPIRRGRLERADVSIYAGQPKTGELAFRRALTAGRRPAPDPPRPHGVDLPPDHVRGDARRLQRGGRHLARVLDARREGRRRSSPRSPRGLRPRSDVRSRNQVAEDLRHHLDVEVGQPARAARS